MSQYTNFFLKGEDKFYSLGDWSRGSSVAEIANPNLPSQYDVAVRCSATFLTRLRDEARERADDLSNKVKEFKKKVDLIASFENSVNEKLYSIAEYEGCIKNLEEEIEAYKYACNYFSFLADLENLVYAGIECGEQPEKVVD